MQSEQPHTNTETPTQQPAPKQNPLIAKSRARIPGTVYRLPSLGKFYENTNILNEDVVDGEVLIYSMRLREELLMKALDAIFQGSAVTETISYCVPQINEPEKLVSEDVDYLLTVIKKLTHGNTITYKDICMKLEGTEEAEKLAERLAKRELDDSAREDSYKINEDFKERMESGEEFSIDEETAAQVDENSKEVKTTEITDGLCEFFIPIDHFIQNCKPINPDNIGEKLTFTYKDFEIQCRPLTFEQFKQLSTLRLKDENLMSNDEFVNHLTDFSNANIAYRVLRVDDVTDPELIYEWIASLSLEERTDIYKEIEKGLDWGIDFEYEVECSKCGLKKKTDQSYLNPLYFFLTS